jgi:pilus assembly protein CpaC
VRRGRSKLWASLLVAGVLVGSGGAALAQEAGGLIRLDVTMGKSQVVDLKEPFSRVSVTNPAVADVFVVTPNQILINGKTVGVTSLVVFYPTKSLFFDLAVHADVGLLSERLKQIAPRDDIQVYPARDGLILTGNVSSTAVMTAAAEVAAAFAPKGRVVNLLSLSDVKLQQVLLQVHVAEADRAALREFGISVRALGSTVAGALFPGLPFFPGIGSVVSGIDLPLDQATFILGSGNRDYTGIVRALTSRALFRTLAKPNLVTQSGKEAKFLSGGEFPYPVAQQNNAISVQFKEFGIGLIFLPVVLDGDTISMRVRPEVSTLDFSQGLQSAGFNIPVIRKNEAFTNINLKDGESFAIAGLLNNDVRQTVAKIPVFGDIPILGALFRSTRFANNETELLFLVTVRLVKAGPPGTASVPDPTKLMELRDTEKKDFTMMPGVPGVGEVVERPFGKSNLPTK